MLEEGSSYLPVQQSGACVPNFRRVQDHDGNKAMSESRAVFSIILRPWLGQNRSDAYSTRATTRSFSPPFLPRMGELAESNFSKYPLELFQTRMRLDFSRLGKEST
jgi:hypothetical protein